MIPNLLFDKKKFINLKDNAQFNMDISILSKFYENKSIH